MTAATEPVGRLSWERVLAALEDRGLITRHRGDGHVDARCPGHDDHRASLTADYQPGDPGKTLVSCHAGCAPADVTAALGLRLADLFDGPSLQLVSARPGKCRHRWQQIEAYRYTDRGEIVMEVVRQECERCGGKNFPVRRPDGRGGWVWKWPDKRPLYRADKVRQAIADGQTIYIVEGEKDVHAAERAGLVATCNPGGAGKWRPAHSAALAGAARVVIVPDRDPVDPKTGYRPGYRHAAAVAESLAGGVRDGLVVAEPAAGKDLSDHLAAGKTIAELVPVPAARLAELAARALRGLEDGGSGSGKPPLPPIAQEPPDDDDRRRDPAAGITAPRGQRIPVDPLTLPSEISLLEARRLDPGDWPYVVPELLPVGAALIYARPGAGKSTMADQLELCVSAGVPIAGYRPEELARSLVIDFEAGNHLAIQQSVRLEPFGQLPSDLDDQPNDMIIRCTEWPGETYAERVAELEKRLRDANHEERPFRLVVIDTMRAFLGSPPQGMNSYQWDAQCLLPLNQLAREMHACVLLIHHPNKAGEVSGSVATAGSVTVVYKLARTAGETEGVLRCEKNRAGPERSWEAQFIQGKWMITDPITTGQAANPTGVKRQVIDYLTERGPATGPDIRLALFGVKDTVLKNAMTRLRNEGWIDRGTDGLWSMSPSSGAATLPPPAAEPISSRWGPDTIGGEVRGEQLLCAVCGDPMDPALAAAGEITHPNCDPRGNISAEPAPEPEPGPPAEQLLMGQDDDAETCPACLEVVTGADTHPDCEVPPAGAPRWKSYDAMRAALAKSRMRPVPWIPPEGDSRAAGKQHRGMPQWQAAIKADAGAEAGFRWERPGLLEEFGPDRLVMLFDRSQSFTAAASSVPLAPNVLTDSGALDRNPRELGAIDPQTGKPTGLAGVAEVIVPVWEHPEMPHPLGRRLEARIGQREWIATGALENWWKLHGQELIGRPEVTASYTGRRSTALLDYYSAAVREARKKYADDPEMLAAVKRSASIALRVLYPITAKSPWWRPDWRAANVTEAMIRHWAVAWRAVQAGEIVAGLGNVDAVAFLLPEGADPETWAPTGYKLGRDPGTVHPGDIRIREGRADLSGIDPARISPTGTPGYVRISGYVPLGVWVMRHA